METDRPVPLKVSLKLRVVILFGLLTFATICLDRVLFGWLFFEFPNETEWDSSPWYNFLKKSYDLKKNPLQNRTLFVGSSVTLYSILPEIFREESKSQKKFEFYSHVAMAPSDLFYYKEDLVLAKPAEVIYLLNFADLQWEYLESKDGLLNFQRETWIREFSERYPAKVIYPFSYFADFWTSLDRKTNMKLLGRSTLYASRYRSFFWDPIETFFDNHFGSGRRYHIYQGVIPEEGIWSKGWTKLKATIHCRNPNELDYVYVPKKGTRLQIRFRKNSMDESWSEPIFKSFSKSGWNPLDIQEWSQTGKEPFWIELQVLDSKTTAKDVFLINQGKDELVGVRLSHTFCQSDGIQNDLAYTRKSFWDDTRFFRMSLEEFQKDYEARMWKDEDTRPELWRLHTIRQGKRKVKNLKFTPWEEYNRILAVTEYLRKQGIPTTVILSPENPWEFQIYKDSVWRQGWVSHLKENLEHQGVKFFDHTQAISEVRYFFDPHHLTYEGAEVYSRYLYKILNQIELK